MLPSLPLPGMRALGARMFIYADRHGGDPGMLKRLYGWCLRGTPLAALDPICAQIATHISPEDRAALHALGARDAQMAVLSCGTAELSQGTLLAAGLSQVFAHIEANRLLTRDGRIVGIERRIYRPETKVEVVSRYGIPWEQVIAVGDGHTDLPLLDRAGLPILIAAGDRARRFSDRPYRIVPSLSDALALVAAHTQ